MLTDLEKEVVEKFRQSKIPSIYKLDDTDNILYVEHVIFDLCKMLLKRKRATKECVQEEIKAYATFLGQLSIFKFDEEAINHLKLLNEVINIFLKYNL